MLDVEHQLTHLLRHDRSGVLATMIKQAVAPSDRVLDAGTGTGIVAFLALRAGAASATGVDLGDLSLARRLAADNGLTDRIRFVQADLTNVELEDAPFDVVFAFVYLNDLRRDEPRSQLAFDLTRRFMRPGGQLIPDGVRYWVQPVDWPSQDVTVLRANLLRRVGVAEATLGVSLAAITREVPETVFRGFFPKRSLQTGDLIKNDLTPLGDRCEAFTLDYRQSLVGYPEQVSLRTIRPGRLTALLWRQDLMFQGEIVFRNECVTWVANPQEVAAGTQCNVLLDEHWRRTNEHIVRCA